jgi:hypothetical protein
VLLADVYSVPHKVDQHIILISVFLNLMQPVANMVEGLSFIDIVNYECCLTIFVEELCDGAELLLPCGVPNLQLNYRTAVHLHDERSEFHSNRDLMIRFECALS